MSNIEIKSFGEILRAAREEKNIALPQVAETLKLSLDIVESIENSDLDALPPATFTCGYLRLFAKLVELNESDVIQAYYDTIGKVPTSKSSGLGSTSDLPTQASSDDLGMRIISYSLVIVVIALFVYWLSDSQKTSSSALSDTPVEKTISSDESTGSEPDNNQDPAVDSAVEEKAELNYFQNTNQPTEKLAEKPAEKQTAVDNNGLERSADQAENTQEINAEEEKQAKIIALAKQANPVADTGSDVLLVSAADDCWVEITDRNGQLLFFSLLKKDKTVELQGQQPFKVFLGKATAISMLLNDIEYDFSKKIRRNQVARFTMSMNEALESSTAQTINETAVSADADTDSAAN
ncbi:MAG: DUF4115 domain-containing protein [Gammaproteobacteria bacterium]|nr:DUF4115 domain-containing protein [Gammaproteobacteria bacterium]